MPEDYPVSDDDQHETDWSDSVRVSQAFSRSAIARWRSRRTFRMDLKPGRYYGRSETQEVEQEPLPERLEHEDPRAYIVRVLEPTSEAKVAAEQDITEKSTYFAALYFDKPHKLKDIKTWADESRWLIMGKTSEPMPEGISDSMLSTPQDRSFGKTPTAGPTYPFNDIIHKHTAPIAKNALKYKDAITELYTEIIEQSALYTILKGFQYPPEQLIHQEAPLNNHEKLIAETVLREQVATKYDIALDAVAHPEEGSAFREFMVGRFILDDATKTSRVRINAEAASQTAFDSLTAFVDYGVRQSWQKLYAREPSAADFTIRGPYTAHYAALGDFISQICPNFDFDLPTERILLEHMLDVARQDPDERCSYEQALADAVDKTRKSIYLPSVCMGNVSIKGVTTLVWLRQTPLPPFIDRAAGHEPQYGSVGDNSMVAADKYEELLGQVLARIVEDKRTPKEREQSTLCLFMPRDTLLGNGGETVLTLAMSAQEVLSDQHPHLVGYTLVSETKYEDGSAEYGFARDGYNPYDIPRIPIDTYMRSSIAEPAGKEKLTVLRNAIMADDNLTVARVASYIAATSKAYIPQAEEFKDLRVISGVAYTQCRGANRLLAEQLKPIYPDVRTISGYVLAEGMPMISKLRHMQTLIMHNGRRYFLDATPDASNLENLPPRPELPVVSDEPKPKQLPRAVQPEPVQQQEAPQLTAEHIYNMYIRKAQAAKRQLENALCIRFGIEVTEQHATEQLYEKIMQHSLSDEDPLRRVIRLSLEKATNQMEASHNLEICQAVLRSVDQIKQLSPTERKKYTCIGMPTLDVLRTNLTQMCAAYASLVQSYATTD